MPKLIAAESTACYHLSATTRIDARGTIRFREATVYLEEDSDVCRAFARCFALASPQ